MVFLIFLKKSLDKEAFPYDGRWVFLLVCGLFFFFNFIKFTGVALVYKMIQVSSMQFDNTSYCSISVRF